MRKITKNEARNDTKIDFLVIFHKKRHFLTAKYISFLFSSQHFIKSVVENAIFKKYSGNLSGKKPFSKNIVEISAVKIEILQKMHFFPNIQFSLPDF